MGDNTSTCSDTGHVGRTVVSSGRATHSSRIGAPVESSAVLDQVKEGLLGPLVVYQHRERFGCGSALKRLAKRPGEARPATSRRASPRSAAIAAAAAGSTGRVSSCFRVSTTGQ